MTAPIHLPDHEQDDILLARQRHKRFWRRGSIVLGIALLLVGYALLAVSPETPSDWVLIRVAAGFGLLFIGFGLAVLPMLTRVLSDNE